MDQPDLDEGLHLSALTGLRRINSLSRTASTLWSPIQELTATNPERNWRVLDVACGGGDVAVAIARRARRAKLNISVDGCDISPRAIDRATRLARSKGANTTSFFKCDALAGDLPPRYDIVVSSLFLHHLDEDDAILLLGRMGRAACYLVLVSDLRRGLAGSLLAWTCCHLLSRSPVVHFDGPASARAAFTIAEARELARRSGLISAELTRSWPQRFLLQWRRP